METTYIDINCDVGEGLGNENELMPLISSCSIACGGHTGDHGSMREAVGLAQKFDVKIGAHPSYPDRRHFGRVSMDISKSELIESIRRQVGDFESVLKKENGSLNHIKAHGALYNDAAKDRLTASALIEALADYKDGIFLYVPYGSVIAELALDAGFQLKFEAFADRNYNTDLSLMSRELPDAIIKIPKEVLRHLLPIVSEGRLITPSGDKIPIRAETFCVHGDHPMALEILNYLSSELPKFNIRIKK